MTLLLCLLGAVSFSQPLDHAAISKSPNLDVVDYEGLQDYLEQFEGQTLVVNFWATWCIPCVKELPYFEELTEAYADDDVHVVLVSLDFSNQIDRRLVPFLEKHQLKSDVIVLDDPDANVWIRKVSPDWSGAIPATLVRKGGTEAFYQKSFRSFEELDQIIQPFLKS